MLATLKRRQQSSQTLNEFLREELRDAMFPAGEREPAWISPELREAIQTGWRATYSLLFDKPNTPFVDVLAWHHRQAIVWHWVSRHRICLGMVARFLAYFSIWSRGHMKSTVAKRIAVVDAVLSVYYGKGGYCLYVSGTDEKTEKHSISIDRLLQDCVRPHVPALAEVRKSKEGGRTLGWKATFFYTRAGYVFHFGSLQSGLAGGNVDDVRPTLIVPDDIDDRKDSPVISEKNFKMLTTEILPMGAKGTLTFWAQNLISRYSSMFRIQKQQVKVLVDRKPTKPVPAIRNLVTETRTIDGTIRDIIVGGTPTWPYFDIAACQDELNRFGLPSFLRECQHEVDQSTEGLMIHTYDDKVHPISVSEFESVFGTRSMPAAWPKQWGNDWARTKTAKHANVAIWQTVSSQSGPLPGFTFYWHPMSFKANVSPEDVAERVLSCLDPYALKREGTRLNPIVESEQKRVTWSELRRDELLRANALAHTSGDLERFEFERAILAEIIPQYSEPVLERHNVVGGVNSHEREDIRSIYQTVYSLPCRGVNPGKFGGIEQLNRNFRVDPNEPHPFRPEQMGFTRTFIVVPDDVTQKPTLIETEIDGKMRTIEVYPPEPFPDELQPDDLHDDKLLRYQMMNWRIREAKITETGETIDEPLKMNDDMGNAMQMLEVGGALANTPLTIREKKAMLVRAKIPELVGAEGNIRIVDKKSQQQVEFASFIADTELAEVHGEDAVAVEVYGGGEKPWWEGE